MITSAFFLVIFTIANGLLSQLPDVTTTSPFSAGVVEASGYLSGINGLVPVDSVLLILTFYAFFEFGYFTFKVVYWIIRRFPTQS